MSLPCFYILTLQVGVNIKQLILTIDIDNDFIDIPRESNQSLMWKGLEQGLPLLLQAMEKAAIEVKQVLNITVFCRADWQIKAVMGCSDWVFKQTIKQIKSLNLQHVHIDYQWHPHLYSLTDNQWKFTLKESEQCQQLIEVYNDLKSSGYDIQCSRIGECFFSNTILKTLIDLNISIDSTALPGRDMGYVNWNNAPTIPFYPNKEEYSSADSNTANSNFIIEVPFSMIDIFAPYDTSSRERYLNTVYHNKFTKQGINSYNEKVITTIAHPFEVLPLEHQKKHQLLGDEQSVFENIINIFQSHQVKSIFLKDINLAKL
jgi:hypothetical protein